MTSNLFRPVRSISRSPSPFLSQVDNAFQAFQSSDSQSVYLSDLRSLLCDAGAHLDCVNTNDEILTDIAQQPVLKELLTSRMKLSLKCPRLRARIIRGKHLPVQGFISFLFLYSWNNH